MRRRRNARVRNATPYSYAVALLPARDAGRRGSRTRDPVLVTLSPAGVPLKPPYGSSSTLIFLTPGLTSGLSVT